MDELHEFLVLYKIGGAGDPETWLPGSTIRLDAERARLYLDAGLVCAIETTKPLPKVEPVTVEHKPEPESKPAARSRKKDGD